MRISFFGAAQVVTGSCFLLETEGLRLLIDCGLFQGSAMLKELNYGDFPFDPRLIDLLILTHAHIDHSGLIPKLVKHGFRGPIYATQETVDFCSVLLPDSGHIQEMEVERKNRKRSRAGLPPFKPIYTAGDALACVKRFQPVPYRKTVNISPTVCFELIDGGHILGSAQVLLMVRDKDGQTKKILFSGDIGNYDQPYVNDPTPIACADVIVMESTYGNRVHEKMQDRVDILSDYINEGYALGGKIIFPAFAVERTQDILYYLQLLQSKGRIPVLPIYIDSPLAIAATEVFLKNQKNFDAQVQEMISEGFNPLQMANLHFSQTIEESARLNTLKGRAIIISASGMADAGRIKHHLKHNLWREDTMVIFTGYQAKETLGRRLLEGSATVRIHGETVCVGAQIRQISGFSSHADLKQLLNWLKQGASCAEQIILVHGEKDAMSHFGTLIGEKYGKEPLRPELGQIIGLSADGVTSELPDQPWPKILARRSAKPHQVSEKPDAPKTHRYQKVSVKDVDAQYEKLRKQIKGFLEQGKKERDYEHLVHVMKELSSHLERERIF